MSKNNLNFIPYDHKNLGLWRNSLKGGISYLDDDTNLIIHGGIDDLWYDLDNKKIIVVDYKAQSSNYPVNISTYLNNKWHNSYKLQMDIYVHILRKMEFDVSETTFFLVCNGKKDRDKFDNRIIFENTLIPYKVDISWIQKKILEMKKTLNSIKVPEINPICEKCAYLKGGKNFF